MRQHMVATLQHREVYTDKVKDVREIFEAPIQWASYNTAITFTNDDLLLRSKLHNHPLFVSAYIREQKIKCEG